MSIGIGDTLREARLSRGEDLAEIAEALKIRRSHIVALETEDFESLGAATYARGHLRNYARHLGLDSEAMLATYDAAHQRDDQSILQMAETTTIAASRPREPVPRWLVVIGIVTVVLVALAIIGNLGGRTPAPVAGPVPTTGASPSVAPPSSGSSPAVTASPTPTPTPTPTPSPTPTPTPTPEQVELFLAFEDDVWVSIAVDGAPHPLSQTIIDEGTTLALVADEIIEIRYGNAGGVEVDFGGRRLGRPGRSGEVVDMVYTLHGSREVT